MSWILIQFEQIESVLVVDFTPGDAYAFNYL